MALALPFYPARLFVGIISTKKELEDSLKKQLNNLYGPFVSLPEPLEFNYTDYYEKEMGKPLYRYFLIFEKLIDPTLLSEIKHTTNKLEENYASKGKRSYNLDPGLMTTANIILATTKNRSHRIPLKDGIYGELTLLYTKGEYHDFDWTYPDYKSSEIKNLFSHLRSEYLEDLKQNG